MRLSSEHRGQRRYYYRVRRGQNGQLLKVYCGSGVVGQRAFEADLRWQQQREQSRSGRRAEEARLHALDAQSERLGKRVRLLASAVLTVNGYYQHQRESHWRKRRGMTPLTDYPGREENTM